MFGEVQKAERVTNRKNREDFEPPEVLNSIRKSLFDVSMSD